MLRIYNLEKLLQEELLQQELLQQVGVFVGPGPAAVVEHAPRDWKGDSVLCNPDHKYVYRRLTEVALGSVQNRQIGRTGRNEIQQKPPKRLVAKSRLARQKANSAKNRWMRR